MKLKKIHIDNYKLFNNFDLDLTHNGKSQNLIVIAGINGSGKTTLLKEVIYQTIVNQSIHKGCSIEIETNDKKDRTFVIDSQFLQLKSQEQINKKKDLFSQLNHIYYYEAGLSVEKENVKNVILKYIDSLIYEKDIKSSEAYKIAQDVLDSLFNGFDLQIEFKGVNRNECNQNCQFGQLF